MTEPAAPPAPAFALEQLADLRPAPYNPREISPAAAEGLGISLAEFGPIDGITWNRRTGVLVSGHQRVEQLRKAGAVFLAGPPPRFVLERKGVTHEFGIRVVDWPLEKEKAANIAANNPKIAGEFTASLDALLKDVRGSMPDDLFVGLQFDSLALEIEPRQPAGAGPSLADRFLVPPFTVLDARRGYWQDRKRQWLDLVIRSEEGRGENLLHFSETILRAQGKGKKKKAGATLLTSLSGRVPTYYAQKEAAEARVGRKLENAEFEASYLVMPEGNGGLSDSGTSVFDPVLCELAYRWFSPKGGTVLDPVAGGSVRGIVAAALGRSYVGVELREEQVKSNREQWTQLARPGWTAPSWHCGDSQKVVPELGPEGAFADLVFSCPPYADLERYSDDPRDLSTMDYGEFAAAYARIIAASVARLRPNRFAVFVVGEVRDPRGLYRGFVPDTIRAFEQAGAHLYNEAVLVTMIGSLAMRIARPFAGFRKLGKTHQNILVFLKGDPKAIPLELGELALELDDDALEQAGRGAGA